MSFWSIIESRGKCSNVVHFPAPSLKTTRPHLKKTVMLVPKSLTLDKFL